MLDRGPKSEKAAASKVKRPQSLLILYPITLGIYQQITKVQSLFIEVNMRVRWKDTVELSGVWASNLAVSPTYTIQHWSAGGRPILRGVWLAKGIKTNLLNFFLSLLWQNAGRYQYCHHSTRVWTMWVCLLNISHLSSDSVLMPLGPFLLRSCFV